MVPSGIAGNSGKKVSRLSAMLFQGSGLKNPKIMSGVYQEIQPCDRVKHNRLRRRLSRGDAYRLVTCDKHPKSESATAFEGG